ncbi:hypothetical protein [Halosimplex salinum]|uniref:hypothetical protein n=1 Tax=Halosimplex salinum TaxID=1710538 RepID=UPI000F4A467B|nr:hypothetical protein [Halosimplex salinum]
MGKHSTGRDGVSGGGEPETLGQCADCGDVYTAQRENGDLRPIGTDGRCECGNDTFETVIES